MKKSRRNKKRMERAAKTRAEKPTGMSKYGRKHALQLKGKFSANSPFKIFKMKEI